MVNDISTLDFVAFDTETTGLYPASEALVEIGAVRFNLLTGATEHFQTFVNPGKPIPLQATRVHGITDEMVFEAPSAREALPAFFQFLEGAVPVAHNAGFDLGFLSLHGLRNGVALPSVPVLDTLMFSRRVLSHLPSHKLEVLVRELAVPGNTFHRALADARSCMEVFRHVVGKSCGVNASWEDLRERHGRTLVFEDGS
ncbi:MAG: 3'-5' exonuclease, partial [Bdellovibrionales bacterium]|nr:3'-5' exonuclease [Bdellovibrionales bacterium]